MSFMIKYPDGNQTYMSGLNESVFLSYKQMETKALALATRVGGTAHYENGNPRFTREGVDLFPRWVPLGEDYSVLEKNLTAKHNEAYPYLKRRN